VTKLESLADRPATKDDVGKTVYWINVHGQYPIEIMEFKILKIKEDIICSDFATAMINSYMMYWNRPTVIAESEYTKLRDLVERAKKMLQPTLRLMACDEIEQWLKEAKELKDENSK
jgi:hypothetical protein